MKHCPLVLIEWDDSRLMPSQWKLLADLEKPHLVKCVSVGWLIHDDQQTKRLASNMGSANFEEELLQVVGVIEIPAKAVTKITKLREPKLTSF